VLQRVVEASVTVEGRTVAAIGPGLCVLVGFERGDGEAAADRLARRVASLRIFDDDDGRLGRSLIDTGGAALVVSQFTLVADTGRGTRPSFGRAARAEEAEPLFDRLCAGLGERGVPVATGVFGAHMAIRLVNDGPVTLLLG